MSKTLRINPNDNVAVALTDLVKGEEINGVILLSDIPCGHKVALTDINEGENVIKYGYPIGHATTDIAKGSHVHTHNIATNLSGELEYSYHPSFRELPHFDIEKTVKVYKRKDGRYGIRNSLLIVPLVGCVNAQAELIRKGVISSINASDIDDVIVTKHPYGCSQLGGDMEMTIKTLRSIIHHPNAGGVLVLALGCENNQLEPFMENLGDYDKDRVCFLKSQAVEDEVEEGIKLCLGLVEKMKEDHREEAPLSAITIGLKCGGSDGFSGISANPLVGVMSDYIVSRGGSTILSEVPEMFGAEQILMDRAKDEATFDKVVNLINGFKKYYTDHNQVCYENPSPGNKQGGITTLEDKSLGCTQKAGLSKVVDVLYMGDQVTTKGLNLLNGPGNDMVACTNLACAGAHIILFTTGRGTPFGTFVPTMKIATNSRLAGNKGNWIDFNAGRIVDGESMESVFSSFLDKIVEIINGETKTKNEVNAFQEIAIFKDGVTL